MGGTSLSALYQKLAVGSRHEIFQVVGAKRWHWVFKKKAEK